MQEIKKIGDDLAGTFKNLATVKAELLLQEEGADLDQALLGSYNGDRRAAWHEYFTNFKDLWEVQGPLKRASNTCHLVSNIRSYRPSNLGI